MSAEAGLLVALLLILGNALFVAAEFSLVAVRRSAIEPMAINGSRNARITLKALENISVLMAGAQLGITLCSLALGAVAEPAVSHLLQEPFSNIGVPEALLHPISFAIALAVTVFLHVVVGEMVPKNIALSKPEKTALILAPRLVLLTKFLKPIVSLLNGLANITLKALQVRPKNEVSSAYTRDEMADLVEESQREGLLSKDNENILSGALTFDSRNVEAITMQVSDLVTINKETTYEEAEKLASKTGFSRFPMVEGQIVVGYAHIKDIIKVDENDRQKPIHSRDIRKLADINISQSIRSSLKIMQHSGAHIGLVHKGSKVQGIVTLEDVLEELIGEMSQERLQTNKI